LSDYRQTRNKRHRLEPKPFSVPSDNTSASDSTYSMRGGN
jgi:hypothetical protein